jgi:glycosyltransferase involved in cell wall biosynthesis
MIVGFELLSAIPGKCGAVSNLWRNNLSLFPLVDQNISYVVFVTPALYDYYQQHIQLHENLQFHVCNLNDSSIMRRIAFQEKEIPKLLKKYHCALYFTGTPTPTFNADLPIEIFKITGIQFYSIPGEFGSLRSFYHKFSTWKKATRSKFIVVNSNYVKNEILKRIQISEEKVKVIYESLDHEIFNSNHTHERCRKIIYDKWRIDSKYLLYVSDIRPYKNPFSVIKAFERLKTKLRDYKLIMIGQDINGYKQHLIRYVADKNLSEDIIMFDYMEPFDFVYLMRAAEIFIYPSSLETFGTIPLEAMACGTPVIAGNETAIPEICGDSVLLVNGREYEEIADAILKIVDDNNLKAQLAERGLKHVKNFSWQKNAIETVELFREAVIN